MGPITPDPDLVQTWDRTHERSVSLQSRPTCLRPCFWEGEQGPHSRPWTDSLQTIQKPAAFQPGTSRSISARRRGRGRERATEVSFGKITFHGNQGWRRAFSPAAGTCHISTHSPGWEQPCQPPHSYHPMEGAGITWSHGFTSTTFSQGHVSLITQVASGESEIEEMWK